MDAKGSCIHGVQSKVHMVLRISAKSRALVGQAMSTRSALGVYFSSDPTVHLTKKRAHINQYNVNECCPLYGTEL